MTYITIISGFLGVGKTTFANRLLDYYIRRGEKTAYIVNEFGQTGLDSALIEKQGFQTIDIFGGCICCTLRGKITEALREVMQSFEPTRIVFEPSGIFIFEKFLDVLQDDYLKGRCTVDSVITIADSTHTSDAMLVPGNFFANQVMHADTILLSKLEMFQGDLDALVNNLHALNPRAGIIAKPWSELRDADYARLNKGSSEGILADEEHGHEHNHEHGHHGHDHEHHEHEQLHDNMDSVTIIPRRLDAAVMRELEQYLKAGVFGKVYRMKGKVRYGQEYKVLQGTFDSINFDSDIPDGDCSLTFIGKDLNKDSISEHWEARY